MALCLVCVVDPALAVGRGYFGASFADLPQSETTVQTGVVVTKVFAGMAAQKAGLKEGQIVTRIDGSLASDPPTAVELLAEKAAGKSVRLTVVDMTGGGSRSFDIFAVMGSKPTAEFAKLKKTRVRCPSTRLPFCNGPGKGPDQSNVGRSAAKFPGWLIAFLIAVPIFGLLVREFWRMKKRAR
jgi:hypothetical protein